ncbi:MAG: hypothetical protein ACRCTY_10465 [Candidatus Adiutrix sp.]
MEQIFQTEFAGMAREPIALETLEDARAWLVQAVRCSLTENERRFLLSCKAGEPDWSLSGLPRHVAQLPSVRWKLHNIAELQKQAKKYTIAYAKLKAVLGV